MATVSEDAVRMRAYRLWEEDGRIDGHHAQHWRRAQADCSAAGDGAVDPESDRAGGVDGMGRRADAATVDGPSVTTPSGIDGEISPPLVRLKSKPRRWPTPIIDV